MGSLICDAESEDGSDAHDRNPGGHSDYPLFTEATDNACPDCVTRWKELGERDRGIADLSRAAAPLGYEVVLVNEISVETDGSLFAVKQRDGHFVHVTDDLDDVGDYLQALAEAGYWRLELESGSVEVENGAIVDKASGERISLSSGEWAMSGGTIDIVDGRLERSFTQLFVTGEIPPPVGSWHRWPAPVR